MPLLPDDASRVLMPSTSMRLDRVTEDRLVSFALERLDHYRKQMGWSGDGSYEHGSWLWRRHTATKMFEGDFTHRLAERTLYERSNLSLNMVAQLIEQHKARMTRDLFSGDKFFGIVPEGPEDQSPVLKDAERWLHHRGQEAGLHETFKIAGLQAALIRGEAVCKTTLKITRREETRQARALVLGGEAQKDSRGGLITDADEWTPDTANPTRRVLVRDPRVSLPLDVPLTYDTRARDMTVIVSQSRGADVSFPFWADFVAPLGAVHLDNAELLAHCVQIAPPDLLDTLPAEAASSAAGADYREAIQGRGIERGQEGTEQRQAQIRRGEGDDHDAAAESMGFRERRYDEIYLRVDWRGTGRYERVAMLIDRELRWPVYYGPVSELLHWTDRPHPFRVPRIFPYEDRWYGRGYYDRYGPQADFADRCWNRMEMELQRSGNILVENRDAHEAGRAGIPIRFRSTDTLRVTGTATVEDVLKVITVVPQVQEAQAAMDMSLQKLQSEAGVIGPGDATSEALNASNTLGEAQIAEANKSVALEEREGEIMRGFNEILADFIDVEMDAVDIAALAALLENTDPTADAPLPQIVPLSRPPTPASASPGPGGPPAPAAAPVAPAQEIAAPLPQAPPLTGQERAERLMQWAVENRDRLPKVVRIFVTRSRQSQVLAQSAKVLELSDRWLALPPEVRHAQRPVYAEMLRALEVQNVDHLLGPDTPPGALLPPAPVTATEGEGEAIE